MGQVVNRSRGMKENTIRDPDCSLCKLSKTTSNVCMLGKGPMPCEVMIVGEAPGRSTEDVGSAFTGRAGEYLDEVLDDLELPRESLYFTNAVSCRPPDGRTPSKGEIRACNHWLQYQIKKVKPKIVVLLGNTPLMSITGKTGIKRMRGKPFQQNSVWYLPTYQPSYILHGEMSDDSIFRQDFKLLKSLMRTGKPPEEEELSIKIVDNMKTWRELIRDLAGTVSFDIETTGLYPWDEGARVVAVGFGTRYHQYTIPTHFFKLTRQRLDELTEALEGCIVAAHYGKFDLLWMWVHFKVRWKVDFDTGLAHYLLDENTRHGLKELAQRFCGAPNWDVEGEAKREWSPRLIKYHAHDLFYTRKLKFIFQRELATDPQVRQVFEHILMPCVSIFVEAEYEGVYIDESKMGEVEKGLRLKIIENEGKLNACLRKQLARKMRPQELKDFIDNLNWGSPKQIGDLLFNKLGVKPTDKTKTGGDSTSEAALKQMDHPVVKDLIELRGARQQLSFFIDGWKPFLVNSRLHPSFKLTGTVTGRLSCEHPNLQQVPRDKAIRTLIVAPPGWVLIEADLSQIELRIAAELANEHALIQAFLAGKDPHWLTALNELRRGNGEHDRVLATACKLTKKKITDYDSAIDILLDYGADACVEVDYAWKELRKKAKAINFGYLYGMGWRKFKDYAREKYDVILTEEQAQDSRHAYFALYSDLDSWHKRQRSFVRRNGYVRTLSGRKRRLPAAMLADKSPACGEAERQAINSPVQSFANELNLMAVIQLRKEFPRSVYRPVGTVHDSILAYARADWAEQIAKRTLEVMRHPELLDTLGIELRIPIEADVTIGPWGAGEKLNKWLEKQESSRSVSRSSQRTAGVDMPIF